MAGPIRISILANAGQARSEINSVSDSTEKSVGRAKSALKGLAAGFVAFEALHVVTDVVKGSIEQAREAQKVNAQTAAVIKSTGGTANINAKKIKSYADQLGRMSGQNADVIQQGSNLLLTFQNVRNEVGKGNDIFTRATKTATNMAAALGKTPKAAALQLGKALNDPVKGLTALSRAGVQFNVQQTAQIKKMVASGHTLKAQKVILGQLDQKFDGSAKSQATAGSKLRETFRQIEVQIGDKLLPILDKVETYVAKNLPDWMDKGKAGVDKLKDGFDKVEPSIEKVIRFLKDHQETVKLFAKVLGVLTAAAIVLTGVWTVLDAVMTANPIGLIIVGLALMVTALIEAYRHSNTFREIVQVAFIGIKGAAQLMFAVLKVAFAGIVKAIEALGVAGKWLWDHIFQPVFHFIISGIAQVLSVFASLAHSFSWLPIVGHKFDAFGSALDKVVSKANAVADSLNKIPKNTTADIVLNVVQGVVHTTGGHVPGDPGSSRGPSAKLFVVSASPTPAPKIINLNVTAPIGSDPYSIGEQLRGFLNEFDAVS